jgi:hypothetical protein
MPILRSYLIGLAVAHLAWFYFFTTGQFLRPKSLSESRTLSIADLVITTVAGMAISGFGLLFLGFARLLNGFGLLSTLLLEGVLFWLLKGDNWLSSTFWRLTFKRFIKSWTIPAVFIYLLFLALGVPAILPPTVSDSVRYHLAYAADWANAGRIYVDPFLRFPYYANNFLLFDSTLFILKLGDYCHFLIWLCGLLTCFGVLAFFSPTKFDLADRPFLRTCFQLPQFLIPLSVALSPVFLRYLNISYVDIPIGLFILVPVLCAYRASVARPFERELVVSGAFCAGMKLTLIGHVPFFLISLCVASARRLRPIRIASLAVVLVALSLPWYARNLHDAGDPTPPVFNLYLNRPDPIFTKADAKVYTADTITERKPSQLLFLPFKFFADPTTKNFRETGVSALILLLYAPILFLIAQRFFWYRWRWPWGLSYLSAAVIYFAFPWFFSSLGRYSLHWYPVLGAWVGVVVSYICARAEQFCKSRSARWTTCLTSTAFCIALIIPSPTGGSLWFYRNYYAPTFAFCRLGANRERYLEKNLPGHLTSEAVIETLVSEQKKHTRVLALGTESLHFYFREKGKIISIGDYIGPARYRDLLSELESSEGCLPYLTRLDISAVITPPIRREWGNWWTAFYRKFRARLTRCGYTEYRSSDGNIAIFLRSDVKPSSRLYPASE